MIAYQCPCGQRNDFYADARIDGPDGEVVVFIVNSTDTCTACGMTVAEMVAAKEENPDA